MEESSQRLAKQLTPTLRVPPVSGPPSLLLNCCSFFSSFCARLRLITASGLLMLRVKLVSGSSASMGAQQLVCSLPWSRHTGSRWRPADKS
ncbi:hypothetical protein E2C01_035569 [Portunus trituberculatus]|uniref:Uncharacterized protein n=1 Tax=Portunus trituberculatus TaxID=210409 RepID=A0A5B7FA40_PORTR|nr:hypothetical protein [Portunus trituberculatus]